MALDNLPRTFSRPTRQQLIDQWERDYGLRQPGVATGEGTIAHVDACVIVDIIALPLFAAAANLALDADLKNRTEASLQEQAVELGLPDRLPETGSSGFVSIKASAGGVFIQKDKELKDDTSGLRFRCRKAGKYFTNTPVPIYGRDTGPQTNLAAGISLTWTNPIPGLGEKAIILADPDGAGLTGGRNKETVDELRNRISDALANAAAAANDAAIRAAVRLAGKTLGIAVQEVFTFAAIKGPGTTGYCFTLRPAVPGGSRTPNAVDRAAVHAFVVGAFPFDDGLISLLVVEQAVDVTISVEWSTAGPGWADATPWPAAGAAVSAVTDATHFTATASTAPQVGQTIAFYDAAQGVYVAKRILSFTGTGPYVITCDTSNNASDLTYTPKVTETFAPWSDSLDGIVEPVLLEFDKLGPGEQLAGFFDAGLRQKRMPLNTATTWPSALRHKMKDGVEQLATVADANWLSPSIPYAASVGTVAVSVNLLTLGSLLAFPV